MSDHAPDQMASVVGVIDMELLSVIRRWHLREHLPIRESERRTGLSRNTIRKYLQPNAVEVRFKVPERLSRLDLFADKLAKWLRMEAGKDRKARRTARQFYADLVALGYDGSYARVTAFIRQWRAGWEVAQRTTRRGVFVPLAFQPGEAFQFDWSEDRGTIAAKRVTPRRPSPGGYVDTHPGRRLDALATDVRQGVVAQFEGFVEESC